MRIKELRLLNVKIYENDEIIFTGRAEDIPIDLKEKEYNNIYFEGVDVVIQL